MGAVEIKSMKECSEDVLSIASRIEKMLRENEGCSEFLVNAIFLNDNPDNKSYLSSIKKLAADFGVVFKKYEYDEEIEDKDVPYLILGGDFYEREIYPRCHGLKDPFEYSVDPTDTPSVASAVIAAFDSVTRAVSEDLYKQEDGVSKKVVIIGRSGNSFATAKLLAQEKDCTVTLLHTKSGDISQYTKEADCIVSFAGSPKLIKADMVKDGAVIIPVGMKKEDGVWLDDLDYESFEAFDKKVYVSHGIGQLTAAFTVFRIVSRYQDINRA